MTKRPKLRLSIKFKLWLAILSITGAAILSIWLLQVVFLEDYYIREKKAEFESVAGQIVTAINGQGIHEASDALYSIASEHILCIEVTDTTGKMLMNFEGLNYNCYVHQNTERHQQLVVAALRSTQPTVQVISNSAGEREYFVGMVHSQTHTDQTPYVVLITTALAPVREASRIFHEQLQLISIGLLIVVTIVSFGVAYGMTRNIKAVTRAAKQVAAGDLNVSLSIRSNDELSDLSESFEDMARELSKVNVLQKELVANISHDIRTPLTMIRGYAEAIKDITGDDKELREQQLDIIMDEANRLSVLVNDVLDLSLLQAGQTVLHNDIFDLNKKVFDIVSRFALLEQTQGFTFHRKSADTPQFVMADEVRIEQVVYNILGNAVNHIGETKEISVAVTDEGDQVRVDIVDTGKGIARQDLPLIWDRYYKPYKKGTKKTVGTGLGLSIVKAVLVSHQARFGVNSTLGVGSDFWFALPKAKPEEE